MHSVKKNIVIFALSLFSVSCVEKLAEQDGDLGVEATTEDVEKAIGKATQGISVLKSQPGNFVDYEYNVRLETSSVFRLGKVDRQLIDRKETSEAYTFVYFENYYEYEISGELKDEWHKEKSVKFLKAPRTTSADEIFEKALRVSSTEPTFACDGVEETDAEGYTYDCVKYFNLQLENQRVPVPEKIKNKSNCLGLIDCRLDVKYLAYDEVKWSAGKIAYKEEFSVMISPQIPHVFPESGLPPTLSLCSRRTQDFGERKNVLVSTCRVLRDMRYVNSSASE